MNRPICYFVLLFHLFLVDSTTNIPKNATKRVHKFYAKKNQNEVRANWLNNDDFCSRLRNQENVNLQAVTIDGKYIYLMEDDDLYRIPRLNLRDHALHMYNQSLHTKYVSQKWYKTNYLNIKVDTNPDIPIDKEKDNERYHKKMQAGTLKHFHYFVGENTKTPFTSHFLYRSYVFRNGDEYLLNENTKKMVFDSEPESNNGHRHALFHAVTDGNSPTRGYMFYFDVALKHRRRVLFAPLTYYGSPDEGKINFPRNESTQSGLPLGAYALIHNDRSSIWFGHTWNKAEMEHIYVDSQKDFFFHLPFGFIVEDSVYLLSVVTKRVYHFSYFHLPDNADSQMPQVSHPNCLNQNDILHSKEVNIKSKPWKDFFVCNADDQEPSGWSPDITQADYIQMADNFAKPQVRGSFTAGIAILLIGLGLLVGLLLCGVLHHIRHNHRLEKRRARLDKLRTKRTSPSSTSGSAKTTQKEEEKHESQTN